MKAVTLSDPHLGKSQDDRLRTCSVNVSYVRRATGTVKSSSQPFTLESKRKEKQQNVGGKVETVEL